MSITIQNAGIASWPQAVTMSNGLASVTVVPEAARVIAYCIGDGENLLFVNDDERGRVYGRADASEWHNFGGVRFDCAPQEGWKDSRWCRAWPPPPVLNTPRTLEIKNASVILRTTAPLDNDLLVAVTTEILFAGDSTAVQVKQGVQNLDARPRELACWLVAQVPAAAGKTHVFVPELRPSRFEQGFVAQMGRPPVFERLSNGVKRFEYKGEEWKIGFDNADSISASITLFAECIEGERYPDGGTPIELYSAGHMPYMELEALSRLASLEGGEEISAVFVLDDRLKLREKPQL